MAGYIAMLLATVWTAFVVETIIESTRAFGGTILFLGRTLIAPGIRPGILILCGLAASAGLAWTIAVAFARGRKMERRMAAELDTRYQEMTTQAAGDAARAGLLTWRIGELQTSMNELMAKRDRVQSEMELAQRRTSELRALSDDYKRSLTELQDRLITLPDIEDELARRRAERKSADPAS
ncbi:MAG: hypothetical protein ACRDGO_04030 [Actinomycetota bacterium]